MAFKLVCICMFAVVAFVNAGVIHDPVHIAQTYAAPFTYSDTAVGTTHENVVRSYDGTVSHYSKSVDTPFSSVRKTDTRVNNKVYSPVVKTISTPVAYHSAPVAYHTAPVVKTVAPVAYHTAPVVKTVSPVAYHAAPVAHSYAAPQQIYSSPVVKTVEHAHPIAYTHEAPVEAAYHTKTVSYSPASAVAHVSFDGMGAHYEW